jgi:hypothetical protein
VNVVPPPCLSISGISCFKHRNTPRMLVLTTRSHSSTASSAVSASFCSTPALLKAKSRRPKVSMACPRQLFTSSVCDTSHLTGSARSSASLMMLVVSWLPCSEISATTTLAPSSAKAIAVARPMPLAAPVTNATFPLKLLVFIITLIDFIINFDYPVLLVAKLFLSSGRKTGDACLELSDNTSTREV